ncbi:hypothetical protein GcC1_069014 [Golovinomyces cichoracearum]|uniref:Wax synthase domain-containing protein n=1 Tax=Golovinomyces cichoracearum TaxID=62708 RepID=A0A420IQG1_9PEZI|nr:hypothetical protein GcC1_069014 [Golovinomyces cichoracearum]
MASFFPHLISTEAAPTSRVILSVYRHAFSEQVSLGTLRPIVLPYHLLSLILLVTYLSLPHKNYPLIYAARWPLLGFITWFQWQKLWKTSSMNYCVGLGAGLSIAWVMVWSWCLLVFMRPQWDAKRVQRIRIKFNDTNSTMVRHAGGPEISEDAKNFRERKILHEDLVVLNEVALKTKTDQVTYRYYWQSYPETMRERLSWATDLVLNFRGPGWNWAISPLPSLPPHILQQLGESVPTQAYSNTSSTGLRRFDTRRELYRSRMPRLIYSYFLMDILKVIMMEDPYYKFGPTTYALPRHLQPLSPFAIHIYRQCLSSGTIIAGIAMLNHLLALIFSVVCGPKVFGLRGEAWYYPSTWGPFSNIFSKGLGGLWGNYWHQSFRQGFTAPTNYLIRNGYIKAHSSATMLTALILAFGISGFVHWAGSVTLYAETYPSHLILFFALNGFGILVQSTFCALLRPQIKALSKKVRYTGNLIYTLVWMFSTGWILADDFARGGLWLWEPIPFSPLRGLGFGEPDAGWWCWSYIGIGWYSGKNWWESGISL